MRNEDIMLSYLDVMQASEAVTDSYEHLMECLSTVSALSSIHTVVRQYGATETIYDLFAGNNIQFSTESLGETVQKGIQAAIEWLKDLIKKIGGFFMKILKATGLIKKSVKEEVEHAKFNRNNVKVTDSDPVTVSKDLTSANIKKVYQDIQDKVFATANIDSLRSFTDEQTQAVVKDADQLNGKLKDLLEGTVKPIDDAFINDATKCADEFDNICNHAQMISNGYIDVPKKLLARAQNNNDKAQINVSKNLIHQAGMLVESVKKTAEIAYTGMVRVNNRLKAYNQKAKAAA